MLVSGPQVMQGYWNRPDESADQIREDTEGRRWLLTGDIMRMDEQGYFYIVDRKKDMIIVSGYKVYPTEIEQVLCVHPKVEKVSVAGVADPKTGEAVKAYVVLKEGQRATAQEIIEFCRDPRRGLSGYRVPKLVEFRESLPETLIGKVLRRELDQQEEAEAAAG